MKKLILQLITIATLGGIVTGSIRNFIPIYLSEQGYSVSDIGLIYAIGSVVLLSSPLFSFLADKWGRRKAIQLSFIFDAISFFTYTINAYVGKITESLAGATWIVRSVIADQSPKKELSANLAQLSAMEILASIGSTVIGGILIQQLGFQLSLYATAILAFIIFLIIPKFQSKYKIKKMKLEWHFPKEMIILCLISFFWGMGSGAWGVMSPLIYSDFFMFDVIYVGAFFSISGVVYSLPLILLKEKLQKFDARKLVISSSVLNILINAIISFLSETL